MNASTERIRSDPDPSRDSELEAAVVLVARFRQALDSLLGLPDWQDAVGSALDALELSGQRQGVGQIQAVLSLPLDSKKDLALTLLESQARLPARSLRALRRPWGIEAAEGTSLSDLRGRLKLAVNARYRDYKRAQARLHERLRPIADAAARAVCFDASRQEDCRQEAELGLLQAIDRSEPGKPLERYASAWAKRRARNHLMRAGCAFTAPINLISQARRTEPEGFEPPKELVVALLRLQGKDAPQTGFITLDESIVDEGPLPTNAAQLTDAWASVRAALSALSPKQLEVLTLRFGLFNREAHNTLQEVANAVGISRQQVSRREDRALKRLAELLLPLREELGLCPERA